MRIREELNNIFQKEFAGRINYLFIAIVLLVYLFAQLYIGAYDPIKKTYRLDAVFHMDFLYYASEVKQFFDSFPPPNPNFSGVPQKSAMPQHIVPALLGQIMSPIIAIRISNLLWIIVFLFVLRRYFPLHHGLLAFIILCLSVPGWRQGPLGIDLVIRSFQHTPFFIFLIIALFEKNKFWRYFSLVVLPWVHIILFLSLLPFFFIEVLWKRKKYELMNFLFIVIGIFTFSIFLQRHSGVSQISMLLSKVGFKFKEPLVHILPFVAFMCYCDNKRIWLLGGVSFVLATFIQWHLYYFIHILNFCIGLMLINALPKLILPLKKVFWFIVVFLFALFLVDAFILKYNPANFIDPYRPVLLSDGYQKALSWIEKNTKEKDVFLVYPPDEITEPPMIQLIRPLYLGWPFYAEDEGLDYKKRQDEIVSFYNGEIKNIDVKYVFYGPREQKYFPEFSKFNYQLVYKNKFANIYKLD